MRIYWRPTVSCYPVQTYRHDINGFESNQSADTGTGLWMPNRITSHPPVRLIQRSSTLTQDLVVTATPSQLLLTKIA